MGGVRVSHFVQICAGFGGYTFQDLHIVDEKLASSLDLGQDGTILPRRGESRVDQAFSPDRVKTCGLGIYTGYLSASNEALGELLRIYYRFRDCGKNKLTSTRT